MTGPTAEFLQHHNVDPPRVDNREFRPGFRVRTRLRDLFDDKHISDPQYRSALKFQQTWNAALAVRSKSALEPRQRASRGAEPAQFQIDARAALRALENRLEKQILTLLEACIIDDLDWTELGRRLGRHRHVVKRQTIKAIEMLADATLEGNGPATHNLRRPSRRSRGWVSAAVPPAGDGLAR